MQRPTAIQSVWMSYELMEWLVAEANHKAPDETGGVLLGVYSQQQAVVTHIVGPGPNAQHSRLAFCPDYDYQDEQIGRIYDQTNRRIDYLGDWHTHPGGAAYLSRRDKLTLRRIAADVDARCPCPIMLILSPGPDWRPSGWHARLGPGWGRCRRLRTALIEVRLYSETAERRVDVTEFADWCVACGFDPVEAFKNLQRRRGK